MHEPPAGPAVLPPRTVPPNPAPVRPVAAAPAAAPLAPLAPPNAAGSVSTPLSAAGGMSAAGPIGRGLPVAVAPATAPATDPAYSASEPRGSTDAELGDPAPAAGSRTNVQRGIASWYGRRFHGRRTASGERYDMHALSAAHLTLPLPSYARVRNPANGAEVVVRVNDRGPFHPNRIIDLSYGAAQKLGLLNGLGKVEVEPIAADDVRTGDARRAAPAPGTVRMAAASATPKVPSQTSAPNSAAAPAASTGMSAPTATATTAAAPVLSRASAASAGDSVAVGAPAGPSPTVGLALNAGLPANEMAPAPTKVVSRVVSDTLPAATPAPPVALTPGSAAGYWVQLGAFRLREGAEGFRRRVASELSWVAPTLSVASDLDLHRLQTGPYPSRDEAAGIAQRLRDALSLVPMVVERR